MIVRISGITAATKHAERSRPSMYLGFQVDAADQFFIDVIGMGGVVAMALGRFIQ